MESVLSLALLCACAIVCSGAAYNRYPSYGQYQGVKFGDQYVPNNYPSNHYPTDVWGGSSQGHYRSHQQDQWGQSGNQKHVSYRG
ncbi:uncharacterized protein [Haliotis asinina]|uniref:uncharacterized protein isoform X2 n=1 Tax=Haliotis asinina TaxID=109174 RepID=UPI0035319EBC